MLRTLLLRRPALVLVQRQRMIHTTPHTEPPEVPNPRSQFERPSPPRLPDHLQREFDRLQKEAETAPTGRVGADGLELHPDARQLKNEEFDGDRNPVTGEIGGPKTEPTRHGDWSFGGRASDF